MGTDRHTDRQTTNDFLGLLSEPKIRCYSYRKVGDSTNRVGEEAFERGDSDT